MLQKARPGRVSARQAVQSPLRVTRTAAYVEPLAGACRGVDDETRRAAGCGSHDRRVRAFLGQYAGGGRVCFPEVWGMDMATAIVDTCNCSPTAGF